MSGLEARALYNYNPESTNELSVVSNEQLYIINQDLGNGWSLARNLAGNEGMIPSNYYELISSSQCTSPTSKNNDSDDSWSDYSTNENDAAKPSNVNHEESIMSSESSNFGTLRMPKKFLKNGGEDFLRGHKVTASKTEAEVEIITEGLNEISRWKKLGSDHSCQIASHRVDNKFKGLITYITYELKSSYSNGSIKRRYNQFDWLYKQLSEKYPCVIIPPLPAKQAIGRFKNEFIEDRKIRLQKWLNHVTEHPVLSYSDMVKLFHSESDKHKWRSGKRYTEKDLFKNGRFYNTIESPNDVIDWKLYSKQIEKTSYFIENFDRNSSALQESYNRFHKKQSINICMEYEKIGTAIENLSKSLSFDPSNYKNTIDLTHGLQNIGEVYKKIGILFKDQAKVDKNLVEINLEEINSITKEIPSLIELASCGLHTVDTVSKKNAESKGDSEFVETIDKSVRVIARTVDAELYWLQNRREYQLRSTMSQYVKNQIQLFTQITEILKETLSHIDH